MPRTRKPPETPESASSETRGTTEQLVEPPPEPPLPDPEPSGPTGPAQLRGIPPAGAVDVVMTRDVAAQLREPFKPEQIGLLPKPTNKDNAKGTCEVCGKYHGLPAVHLDYVGHAAATDRLLQVDPNWQWAPMAVQENGMPVFDSHGGLWITLTVAGVTRPGYGDATNGKGVKEVIGDALRNAAMRFGVALDLWSKEDLHATGPETDDQAVGQTGDLRNYDPAGQLIPGAPRGWKAILEALTGLEPSMDWGLIVRSALEQAYGVDGIRSLGSDEVDAGTRIANATALMLSEHPVGEMPPIPDEEIVEAFRWAFGGRADVAVTIPEADPGALGTNAPEGEPEDLPDEPQSEPEQEPEAAPVE